MEPETTALITDPMGVFGFLAAIVAGVFWVSELPRCKKLFEVVPPVIYVYFLPMLATTAGITPSASPLYDWTVPYLLLFALLMLMVSVDVMSIARLGGMALFMVAAGTVGIVIGGPISLLIFQDALPADAWTGFAALSGSWIGGTANMVAIAESVGTSPDAMGPVIVVDTVVGYGWMGVLIALVGFQSRFDRRTRARTEAVEETNSRLAEMDRERTAHHAARCGRHDRVRHGVCGGCPAAGPAPPGDRRSDDHQRHHLVHPHRRDRWPGALVHAPS